MALSPDDERPPYLQIAEHLRGAIHRGDIPPGGQLPSATELAGQFEVARNTVRSALRLLNEEGLVVARQGSGVFVRSGSAGGVADGVGGDELRLQLEAVMTEIRRLADRVAELEVAVQRREGQK